MVFVRKPGFGESPITIDPQMPGSVTFSAKMVRARVLTVPLILAWMKEYLGYTSYPHLGLGLIFGRVISGYLMDHFFAPYIASAFTLMFVVGVAILASGASNYLVFVAATCIGLSLGSEISETAYLVSRYFGPKAYGIIYGIMFAAFQLGASFGPPALGKYYVLNGNYLSALWGLAVLGFIAAVLVAALGKYPDL